MQTDDKNLCLSFLTLSLEYLNTTKNILDQMVNSGNRHVILQDHDETEDMERKYEEITKWSDFNVLVPTLFLFYHGIEILLKGFLMLKEPEVNVSGHNLEDLFCKIKKNYPKVIFIEYLTKYLVYNNETPQILKEFIESNNAIKNMNDFYIFLKYPTDIKRQKRYDYFRLKYKEKNGVLFAQELKNFIEKIIPEIVKT